MPENDIDNKPVTSKRDIFLESIRGRYPDLDVENEDEFYGRLNDEFDRFDRGDKAQRELGDLLASDPRSAGFLMVMRKGGNPVEYLIENYGDDFKAALESEEGKNKFSEAFSKYMERQTRDKELQKQAEDNLRLMIQGLEEAQSEGKFSDEDARAAYEFLYADGGLLDRIVVNGVTKDDWMMLMKAANYDKSMMDAAKREEEARNEGEIAGRNANIDINKRKSTKVDRLPPDLGSSGGMTSPTKKERNPTIDRLDKITGRKSVWQ